MLRNVTASSSSETHAIIRPNGRTASPSLGIAKSTVSKGRNEFRAQMPLREIHVRPQVRQHFKQDHIDDLAASIQAHGILQPLLVRRVPGGYELVAGERRLRAAQRLGLTHVPVTVRHIPDEMIEDVQVVENLHRQELNEIEKTEALLRLYARQVLECTPQEAIRALRSMRRRIEDPTWAERIKATDEFFRSKNLNWQSFASSNLVNLGYPEDVKDLVRYHGMDISKAKILVRVKDEALRIMLGNEAVEKNLSVRELEAQINRHLDRPGRGSGLRARAVNMESIGLEIMTLPATRRRAALAHFEALRAILGN